MTSPLSASAAVYTSLITADELAMIIDRCVVIDCRHELTNPTTGRAAYAEGHLPNAVFLHQDEDMASPKNGTNGRHPLPSRELLLARLREAGLSDGQQLVAYDANGGMYGSRLWWLANWLGHPEVAVLDGGITAWTRAGFPLSKEVPLPHPGNVSDQPSLARAVSAGDLVRNIDKPTRQVIDARAGERFRGETEPMDPVAGHIPGALNRPQVQNLRPDGTFKPAEVLAAEFKSLLGDRPATTVVHSCGSGISACHNLLAMEYAGLRGSALYPGSWSEWVADPARPVATGPA